MHHRNHFAGTPEELDAAICRDRRQAHKDTAVAILRVSALLGLVTAAIAFLAGGIALGFTAHEPLGALALPIVGGLLASLPARFAIVLWIDWYD
jgi:hypothetical protein